MKRGFLALGILIVMTIVTACEKSDDRANQGNIENYQQNDETVQNKEEATDGIDVDLTTLSSTMVYGEVYNMYMSPDDYEGKIVKAKGAFSVVEVPESEVKYFSIVIEDATGCCAQGMEFELTGDSVYPEDYPQLGEIITLTGEFETYYEEELRYVRLKNAVME